jgi:predicted nuclease with TOPRIM domain
MIDELEADLSAKDARIADQADRIDQLESENIQLAERLTRLEGHLEAGVAVTGTTPADD